MVVKFFFWKLLRTTFVILYALFLIFLIPTFFYNYEGEWMKRVAEKLRIKEINLHINKPEGQEKKELP